MQSNQEEIKFQEQYSKQVREYIKETPMTYFILTMGCQLNENDSEKLCGMLEEMGYERTYEMQQADLIVMNTCCVRENAEDKLFGKLGEAKKVKEHRGSLIAVGGCMMQENHMVEKIHKSYPFCDIIFGTHTLHKLPENVYKALLEKKKIEDVIDIDGKIYEDIPIKRENNIKASVAIMNGCNNFCSYCIVPYVRGRERSRNPEEILKEIQELAKEGYKEITLLGQNVNSYDGGKGYRFSNLLQEVENINGIEKIRFVSPHPKDFSEDVIQVIAKSKKISRIIHLPLQSGSTKVLKAMNRKYSKEQYLQLVETMKNQIPEVSFSTDIIVGFPGETEEDFEDTLDVVKKVGFEQVFMFIYSRRVGTPADKMENQIPEEVKHKRFNQLKQLVEKQTEDQNEQYVGTIQKVLVEGISKNNPNMLAARTDSNKVVVFEGEHKLIGHMVKIKITQNCLWYLKAKLV